MTNSLPTIRRFNSIKGLGNFTNHKQSPETPEFKEANLVYGFNGTGKTTLSRIFGSLEAGVLRPEISSDAEFEIELSNGSTIKHNNNLNALKGRILVFNTDFVDANFRWKDGKANPVFYLGSQQAKLSQRLESLEEDLFSIAPKTEAARETYLAAEKAFVSHKRTAARQIGESINQARGYDATTLTSDYQKLAADTQGKLDDAERERLRQLIYTETPLPKLSSVEFEPPGLPALASLVDSINSTTFGEIAIQELRVNASMLSWAKEGADYHENKGIKNCLLCGNTIQDNRLRSIRAALDDKFNDLQERIQKATERTMEVRNQLIAARESLPSKETVSFVHREKYVRREETFRSIIQRGISKTEDMIQKLANKNKRPNEQILLPSMHDASKWAQNFESSAALLNSVIERHNSTNDKYKQVQDEAKAALKQHFLLEGLTEYNRHEASVRTSKAHLEKLQAQAAAFDDEIASLRQALRQHGPAAARINNLVESYLGHSNLKIEALKDGEEGYEILRNKKSLGGPLSEGEKTAVTLCYFLSTLEAERRKLKDLIVVVDDPISSLDTRALHYAFSLVRGSISGASQLIILTHNIHFMNENKKWLKEKAKKGTATLLFLDTTVELSTGNRSTKIVELPTLIRDYESEYHYLFGLLIGFNNAPQNYDGYFYLMPNALRKIMDIFFAFKVPGPHGLSSKLESPLVKDSGIGTERARALDRLAQLESHADSLDDLVALSSLSLEETKEAASALLNLLDKIDSDHCKQMRKLCGSSA